MRLIRLGIVVVLLAGCGVAGAGPAVQLPDPNDECPPGSEMPAPLPDHEGWECYCVLTGEAIGQIDLRGVYVPYASDGSDGDCATPVVDLPADPLPEGYRSSDGTAVMAPPSPVEPVAVPVAAGQVLRRTG